MKIERLASYEGLPTILGIARVDEFAALASQAPRKCSLSWFVHDGRGYTKAALSTVIDAINALSPVLVHVFGPGAERIHDLLDTAMNEAQAFMLTMWSEQYTVGQAMFNIFCVDFPPEELAEGWSARLVVVDAELPNEAKDMIVRTLREPESAISAFLKDD